MSPEAPENSEKDTNVLVTPKVVDSELDKTSNSNRVYKVQPTLQYVHPYWRMGPLLLLQWVCKHPQRLACETEHGLHTIPCSGVAKAPGGVNIPVK
ncbi:hypothetical protein HYFRA_00013651 [Hymenoscyphus fraxineus]|uniref:Uncharacterized protein n=1 Tax=Hymenoscyphus fraxineus TaxID=746836 RepID=A0A9N9LDC7_9HELO|nr:hypothetical protein HYFRA_00013651 [Hymenoscyphus fraxineus]